MRVAVLEDDMYVRQQVVTLLRRLRPHWHVQEADSLSAITKLLQLGKFDAILADIHLSDGCFFTSNIAVPADCQLVFITGDAAFALKAFESQAVDYLVKPVGIDRILETVERIERKSLVAQNSESAQDRKPRVKYLYDSSIRMCSLEEIAFVRANLKSCEIFLSNGSRGLVQMGINHFQTMAPSDQFWRIHRSYILNIDSEFRAAKDEFGRLNVQIPLLGVTIPVSKANERLFKTATLA